MGKEEIARLLDASKKALEAEHESMRGQVKSELDALKKKALSGA